MKKIVLASLAFCLCTASTDAESVDYTINHIQNGDFQSPQLPGDKKWSYFDQIDDWQVYYQQDLNGVKKKTQFKGEIGIGKNPYNSNWGQNTKVIELDTKDKNVVYQNNPQLYPCGYSKIQFQYAARQGKSLETSRFKVIFNGNLVDDITPSDYNIRSYTVFVIGKKKNNLQFIGLGTEDGNGATIGNVRLFRVSK